MSRAFRLLMVIIILLSSLPLNSFEALALELTATEDADLIVANLKAFGLAMNQLGGFEELGDDLPLTNFDFSGPAGLNLEGLFSSIFSSLPANPPDLAAALDALDDLGSDLKYQVENVEVIEGTTTVINFTLTASRSVSTPVLFDGDVDLAGGSVTLNLQMETDLSFTWDASVANPFERLYLNGATPVNFSVNATGAIGGFSQEIGLTEVSVTGSLGLDLDLAVGIQDPDENGRITRDEWVNTAPVDLFTAEFVDNPGTNAVDALLNLDSTLISGTPDGTIGITDPDISATGNGFNPTPSVSLNQLGNFLNMSNDEILSGFASFAAGLAGLELAGDMRLPFVQEYLGNAYEFAEPLIDFVRQQGDADIVCGSEPTTPPSGTLEGLPIPSTIYCQGYTLSTPEVVTWTMDAAHTADLTFKHNTDTVGLSPSASVSFTLTDNAVLVSDLVSVAFKDPDGVVHSVKPRFTTVQELLPKLLELGGLTSTEASYLYDETTESLVYHFVYARDPDAINTPNLDFGDKLKEATNLSGLSSAGNASATIDPHDIKVDVKFGVLLAEGIENASDRFYLQTNGSEPVFQADVDVSANVKLMGRLGFLQVSVEGDPAENTADSTALFIGPKIDTEPMLSVGLNTGSETIGDITLNNVILFPDLFSDVVSHVSTTCNVRMSSGLKATASIGDGGPAVSGGVLVDWDPVFATGCSPDYAALNVTPKADFSTNLKGFDISPSLFGSYTQAMTNTHTMEDTATATDFAVVDVERGLVGSTLRNLTDGSQCVITSTAANTVTCESGLEGGEVNWWTEGDRYEIAGDPLAMLSLILNNIDLIVTNLEALTGSELAGGADVLASPIPVIGQSPQDLISQFRDIQQVIEEIRTGQPAAVITCGNLDTNPPTGSVIDAAVGEKVYCQAAGNLPGPASGVVWAMTGATQDTNTSGAGAVDTVGTDPTANAVFELTSPGGLDPDEGFKVTVSFNDEDGLHSASLPAESIPSTLQKFEKLLESKLGIPEQALNFRLENIKEANSDTLGAKDLIIELGYGICAARETNSAISGCDSNRDKIVAPIQVPVNLSLDDIGLPGLVGLESELSVEYLARAQFDMGISLELPPKIAVLDTSGVDLAIAASADDIRLNANIGPLSVKLGKDAVITGDHDGVLSTTTMTDTTPTHDSFAADFGVETGDTLYNDTRDTSCTISSVGDDTIDCPDGTIEWDTEDVYRIGGEGTIRLGAAFTLEREPTTAETYSIMDFVGNLTADLQGVSYGDCTGHLCARLSMMVDIASQQVYLGDLVLDGSVDLSGNFSFTASGYERLDDRVSNITLDWLLLIEAIPKLVTFTREQLEAGSAGTEGIPLVGDALDGGAKVARTIETKIVNPIFDSTEFKALLELGDFSDPEDLEATLKSELEALIPDTGEGSIRTSAITVTTYCADAGQNDIACNAGDDLQDIYDVRVTFEIGQSDTYEIPLDIGVPGLPLGLYSAAEFNASWSYVVDFGLSRKHGPYLVASDFDDLRADQEFTISGTVGIAALEQTDETYQLCEDGDPLPLEAPFDSTLEYSSNKCIVGVLGFLSVVMRDSVDNPTQLELAVGIDMTSEKGTQTKQIIDFQALTSGQVGVDLSVSADANVDLRFRTGIRGVDGLPSVVGRFTLEWRQEIGTGDESEAKDLAINFDNIYLDAGEFISRFVAPIAKEVRRITSPLMPVIETVRAPLPVLSDLSKMTGGGDVSLMSLMEAVSGADFTLINRLMDFIVMANELAGLAEQGNLWIPLGSGGGSFIVDAAQALEGAPSPGEALKLIKDKAASTSDEIKKAMQQKADQTGAELSKSMNAAFTRGGLTFPFLQDPSQIFGMLMGNDATLVHWNAGSVSATAGVDFTFRFAIGPVPMSVTLAGSATLEGRFAMGYDTYGFRQVLSGGLPNSPEGWAKALLYGIFIDDLDENGNDVPEITLRGTIRARAAVDLVVVSAGVGGGIELTVELNLDDRPDPDGKLRIEEIISKLANPWCLFEVSGRLEAFLEAFVKVDFFFFSKEWTFELARIVLLEFSAACDPPNPVLGALADLVGKDTDNDGIPGEPDGKPDLILHIGPHAPKRNVQTSEGEEEVVVRQLNLEGTRVSVSAFGIYQEYELPAGGYIYGDGAGENDNISLEPGAQVADGPTWKQGDAIPFTIPAFLIGGDGADQLRTGDGRDYVFGDKANGTGTGNDKINTGGGTDHAWGGPGNDAIDGSFGDDYLYGDAGNDRINGGPGSDHVYGGADNDAIAGGPGSNQSASEPGPTPDTNDYLYGNGGDDSLQGGWGDDYLYGDDALTCEATGTEDADAGNDLVNGGEGNDHLFGGAGSDEINGGANDDTLCGNAGDDRLNGDGDDVPTAGQGHDDLFGSTGSDTLIGMGGNDELHGGDDGDDLLGGKGRDLLYGDKGNDILLGDTGTLAKHDTTIHATITYTDVLALVKPVNNQADAADVVDCSSLGVTDGYSDCLYGGDDNDFMFGENGNDQMFGGDHNDYMEGSIGVDFMEGNNGADRMRGGWGDDQMWGNNGNDVMFGDSDNDTMYGNDDNDIMRGGSGTDHMYGGNNSDTMFGDGHQDFMFGNDHDDDMYGGEGDDHMVGGTGDATTPDMGDEMWGGAGNDVMAGDNAVISAAGVETLQAESSIGGADWMYGDDGEDRMFGEYAGDFMWGGSGDDYMEGNGGADTMRGEGDHDDMIGGGDAPEVADAGELLMSGGPGNDVMVGDNASITRSQTGLLSNTPGRYVKLLDVPFLGAVVDPNASGPDTMNGDGDQDVMYGQSGSDIMSGGMGNDYMEGNAGQDTMAGDQGDDDMVGGSGFDNPDGVRRLLAEVLDAGETEMTGGEGADYMAGDNALILQDGSRCIQLHDVPFVGVSVAGSLSGGDTMAGNANNDVMYGQSGSDTLNGNGGDDYMEGNAGQDKMYGGDGQDDMMGGSGHDFKCTEPGQPMHELANVLDSGEIEMYGGGDHDVMAGDNALILRPGGTQPFNGAVIRSIKLYDLQLVGGSFEPTVSGPDLMHGDAGDDLMFGQGNGDQPAGQADPPDGWDNDRDGRESKDSTGFDCLDGVDNDGDGLQDGADPDCQALTDEDDPWLGDEMHGGAGDDYMEGNHGADWLFGEGDEDDMIGGGSANDGVIDDDRVGDGLLDSHDVMLGGDEDDVMIGDNGVILRPLAGGQWQTHSGFGYDLVVRETRMAQTPEDSSAYGDDFMLGEAGHDEMYGGLGSDYMEGNAGDDAMVGDLGHITTRVEDGTYQQDIQPNEPFFADTIFAAGTLTRITELYSFDSSLGGTGGADTMLGGEDMDSLHGGPGADLMNGNTGEDHLFGGDGDDVVWGGPDHDHLWGGHGDDYLDILPRPAGDYPDKGKKTVFYPGDPPEWFTYAGQDNYQDIDYIYGGWGQDAMQADVAGNGPVEGDRLIDWVGAYNVFYLCPGLYGEYVITRDHSPAVQHFLEQLAKGDGAVGTTQETPDASGFRELAMVFPNQAKDNSHPVHPDNPGHFTGECTDTTSQAKGTPPQNPGKSQKPANTEAWLDENTHSFTLFLPSINR